VLIGRTRAWIPNGRWKTPSILIYLWDFALLDKMSDAVQWQNLACSRGDFVCKLRDESSLPRAMGVGKSPDLYQISQD
jgi:hypothetical protein